MIVISDTSCIGYLIMIEKLFLLEQNFFKVIIPSTVHKEIIQLAPRYDLTTYNQSQWITIAELNDRNLYNQLLNQLDKGESEAIALYKEANADLPLIDERKGTIIARSLRDKNYWVIRRPSFIKKEKIYS